LALVILLNSEKHALIEKQLKKMMHDTPEGIVLPIYVIPGSNKSYLELKDGELIFHSSASCKRHGVNIDLLRWFRSNHLGKPFIVKGWSERKKMLLFHDVNKDGMARKLAELLYLV
jgi:uncharacterized protein YggU (UPF0235/DUF167 family)